MNARIVHARSTAVGAGLGCRPHNKSRTLDAQLGVNMIELLVVLTVLSVVIILAAPYAGEVIQRNRLAADASLFTVDLAFARSEAIKRRQPVSVCGSNDGQTCTDTADWSGGWIVFSDLAGDGSPNTTASGCPPELTTTQDCLLRARAQVGDGDVLRNTATMRHIIFRPDGTLTNVAAPIEFLLCAPDRSFARESEYAIRVGATGFTAKEVLSCP